MAIQGSFQYRGVTIPSAYLVLDSVFGGKTQGWQAVIKVYASQTAFAANDGELGELNMAAPCPYTSGHDPFLDCELHLIASQFTGFVQVS